MSVYSSVLSILHQRTPLPSPRPSTPLHPSGNASFSFLAQRPLGWTFPQSFSSEDSRIHGDHHHSDHHLDYFCESDNPGPRSRNATTDLATSACRSRATALLLTLRATGPYVSQPEPFPPRSRSHRATAHEHSREPRDVLLREWRDVALREMRELVAIRGFESSYLPSGI